MTNFDQIIWLSLISITIFNSIRSQEVKNNNSFSVAVRCSARAMEMFVQFSEPFNGRLKTRPDGQCFVNGRGRMKVGFRLPLDERHRKRCSIVQRTEEFIAIVELEMNGTATQGFAGGESADDNPAYFVRCPILSTPIEENEAAARTTAGGTTETPAAAADITTMISAGQISQFEGEKLQQLVTAATAKENIQMMELQLMGGEKGNVPHLLKCVAFLPLLEPNEQMETTQIGDSQKFCQSPSRIQLKFPQLLDQNGGKFMIQCEIATGPDGDGNELCPLTSSSVNSSSSPVGTSNSSSSFIRLHPSFISSNSSAQCSPHITEYLLAVLLGVLLSLLLVCLCLISIRCFGTRRNNNRQLVKGLPRGGVRNGQKRVQIVCPSSFSSSSIGRHSSIFHHPHHSSSSSADHLSFGSSPIHHPPLFSAPPPVAPFHRCSSPSPPSSPASTVTTALALSLDKLPEPPSLTLAEIRQLNLAFNGLLMANGEGGEQKDDSEGRTGSTVGSGSVYSFAGIRLLNKPNQEGTEEIQKEEEGKEKEMTKMIFFR